MEVLELSVVVAPGFLRGADGATTVCLKVGQTHNILKT